jgi:hypothetical protein
VKIRQITGFALAIASSFVMFGCGEDSNNASMHTPASQAPPPSAMTVTAFIARIQTLISASPDNTEPVAVSAAAPPTSETTEPVMVN